MGSFCKQLNTKISDNKTQAIYFFHRNRPVEARRTLKGWNIPYANHVKYLGVISDKRIIWGIHT